MRSIASKILTECLDIKPLEKILIVTDTKKINLAKLFFDASRKINLETNLIMMEPRTRDGEEPTEAIAEAMKTSDAVIIITTRSLTHTNAVKKALTNTRIVSMPGLEKFSFTHGLTANWQKVKKNVEKMSSKLEESNFVEVASKNGTNVYFSVRGREWKKDTGIIHNTGDLGNLPAGEVFIAPLEDSINGTIVFDHFSLSKGKLKLTIDNGLVKEVKGDKRKLEKVFDQLGKNARQIAEFGIGCNPKAKVHGTLEGEKVFGTVHFALGSNASFGGRNDVQFHLDGIIDRPTVKVDNKILIKNGKWKF